MEMFFQKEKNICNIAIRIEYRIACIAIRIVSQSYCIVTTLLSLLMFVFFDVQKCIHKFTNVRERKRFRKLAITQVILVLKLNVAHKKKTLCHIMSRITSLLFVTQNVIEHNRDLLDESFCDVMKQKFMCVR